MALAINTERVPQRQPRGGQSIPPERHLTVIPGTSKRTILFFSTLVLGLFVVVSSVIGLQAYIAGQQLKLDRLTSEISLARQYHDELRQQRVTLLAPEYLREQAKAMMMTPGLGSKFVEVPQDVVASVVISTGKMDPAFANPSNITSLNPLANLGVAQNEGDTAVSIAAGSRGRRHEPQRAGDIARAAARQTVRTLTEDLKPGKISHRLAYVRIGVSLLLCAMLLRTGYLQTVGSGQYRDASISQRTRVNVVKAERGSILDRNGLELAIPISLRTVFADPREVIDPVGTARAIAAALAMSPEAELALAEKLQNKTASFTYVARQVSQEVADSLIGLQLPGVSSYRESGRELTSDGLRALVGRTDPDGLGISGLEAQFDMLLAGVNGRQVREVSAKGQSIPATQDESIAAISGKTLVTTIDRNIQFQVDGILAQQIARLQARSGTAIVMDSATGEIFAMSTLRLNEDGTYSADSGNFAAVEANEPGSVAKVFSIAAAINEGQVDSKTSFTVPPVFIANKGTKWESAIRDAYPHGLEDMSVRKIFVDSSNVGTLMVGQTIGPDKLHDYLKSFGFGTKSAVDFPGETKGILQSANKWQGAKKFTTSYGYGYSTTALQLIAGVNVVANNGNYVAPRLVTATVTKDGLNESIPPKDQHAVITPETAAVMRSLMSDVVCFGTATLGKVPGMTVAGKTGTAYKRQDNGTYVADDGSRSYFASFVGFIPAQQPRFTVLVSIDEPNAESMDRFGGTAAAPVFANIAQVLISELDIRPDATDLGCPKERPAELGPKH